VQQSREEMEVLFTRSLTDAQRRAKSPAYADRAVELRQAKERERWA
jgi:hypothetical protein